jgi:hypothetical protein
MRTFGVYLSITSPLKQLDPKQGIKKFLTFSYYSHTITNLTNIWHRPEQPWKSHTWIFAYHLPYSRSWCFVTLQREVKLCKVSDGTKVVGKCLKNFLIPCFGSGRVLEWRNIPQTVPKKYTTFSTERIIAFRSVNKIFRESYDFAAMWGIWSE